jgi:hypothetical protein
MARSNKKVTAKKVIKTQPKKVSNYAKNVLGTNALYKQETKKLGPIIRQILVVKVDIKLPAKYQRFLNATQRGSKKAETYAKLVKEVRYTNVKEGKTCVFYVLQALARMDKAGELA